MKLTEVAIIITTTIRYGWAARPSSYNLPKKLESKRWSLIIYGKEKKKKPKKDR